MAKKKRKAKKKYPKPSKELVALRAMHTELVELRKLIANRLPTPLWGQTPAPGPSGTSRPYQQHVNPVPVAVVRMNEFGDWVGEKKGGGVPPVAYPPDIMYGDDE